MSEPAVSAVALEARLREAFAPSLLEVRDDSHLHAGHAGAREGRHFGVRIVSERFDGLSRIARHRLVHDALGAWMQRGIHALALTALSPAEAASH
ncbi:MAG TPA: BolA family protein [Methylibium sp.]|uniref:BolA family protein n=1 Tax=Methylibium sp. TaxID=2067992 RepID=UPI002DBB4A5B|nr:BolA family protein [Methylibium sp.]HEU4459732.1 BolA family protein [Methylibium sp.]